VTMAFSSKEVIQLLSYITGRLLASIPVLVLVSVFVFLLVHIAPGDPASTIAGRMASPDQVEEIRQQLGFDRPIYIQFYDWTAGLLSGDFGNSVFYGLPVLTLMEQRLEPTLSLAFGTLLIAVTIAVPAGIISAYFKGRALDRFLMAMSVLGFSVPIFVIAYIFIYIFSISLGLFPVQGYKSISNGVLPWLHSITLPCVSLGIVFAALIARITRATMIEVLSEDYIRTAHAKGLGMTSILFRHAFRNAAVPVITVIGTSFVMLIGGVVITETVFNIPGLGRLVVDAISQRDFPIIQGMLVIFAGFYVLINLCVDLIYTAVDPRIRY
jgi:peptide/nickel transport system permease protein